ncbi:glycoside hydrolase family 3 N-terminal domain-containing protein [Mesorhizobium marinum]
MSRIILQDILRAELGFGGVVVSDDLGMAAISSRLDQPETTRSIVNAGCDLMCMCAYWADTGIILRMIDHIGEGLKDGSISERTMHESFARVQALLSVAPANRVERLSDETFAAHASLAPLRPRTVARVESGGGGAAKI